MINGLSRPSRRELALVFLMALTGFAYFAGTSQDGNTHSRLGLVRAIAVEHRFEIDTTQLTYEWRDFLTEDRSFYNGHYYSDKAIGSSLVGAALWAPVDRALRLIGLPTDGRVFKVGATFLGVSLLCAFLAPLVYRFVATVADGGMAALVTMALVFGTPLFKYSTAYYGHVQAGLFLFGAFLICFHARRRHQLSYAQASAASALVGFMFVTEYPTALLALVLGGYMLFVLRELGRVADWRVWMASAAGGLLALAPLLFYNHTVYGNLFTTGYQHHATARYAAAHAQGLAGIGPPDPIVMFAMTFHPLMGIFWQSPFLLLAVAGWMAMRRGEARAELWFSLTAILAYVTLLSGYYDWSGGLAYTPRHLIPMLPLFAIPLAFLPRRWQTIGWCLAGWSIVQHLVAVSAKWNNIPRLLRDSLDAWQRPTKVFVSTIWSVCWPNLQDGLFVANRGSWFMPPGFATLLPLLLVELILAVLLARALATAGAARRYRTRRFQAASVRAVRSRSPLSTR
jgi:hypothetical protein